MTLPTLSPSTSSENIPDMDDLSGSEDEFEVVPNSLRVVPNSSPVEANQVERLVPVDPPSAQGVLLSSRVCTQNSLATGESAFIRALEGLCTDTIGEKISEFEIDLDPVYFELNTELSKKVYVLHKALNELSSVLEKNKNLNQEFVLKLLSLSIHAIINVLISDFSLEQRLHILETFTSILKKTYIESYLSVENNKNFRQESLILLVASHKKIVKECDISSVEACKFAMDFIASFGPEGEHTLNDILQDPDFYIGARYCAAELLFQTDRYQTIALQLLSRWFEQQNTIERESLNLAAVKTLRAYAAKSESFKQKLYANTFSKVFHSLRVSRLKEAIAYAFIADDTPKRNVGVEYFKTTISDTNAQTSLRYSALNSLYELDEAVFSEVCIKLIKEESLFTLLLEYFSETPTGVLKDRTAQLILAHASKKREPSINYLISIANDSLILQARRIDALLYLSRYTEYSLNIIVSELCSNGKAEDLDFLVAMLTSNLASSYKMMLAESILKTQENYKNQVIEILVASILNKNEDRSIHVRSLCLLANHEFDKFKSTCNSLAAGSLGKDRTPLLVALIAALSSFTTKTIVFEILIKRNRHLLAAINYWAGIAKNSQGAPDEREKSLLLLKQYAFDVCKELCLEIRANEGSNARLLSFILENKLHD